MKLSSDFRDYYDHAFDISWRESPTFERFAHIPIAGVPRYKMFYIFDEVGIPTPIHGLVQDVVAMLRSKLVGLSHEEQETILSHGFGEVIVYTNEYGHAGKGKVAVGYPENVLFCPNYYCSQRLYCNPPKTLRYLQIGRRKWWLQYTGKIDQWMSNYEPDIKILCEEASRKYNKVFKYPLFAIDFVLWGFPPDVRAVDFNAAPGMKGTGMENLISPQEVHTLISDWFIDEGPETRIMIPGKDGQEGYQFVL